jgi:hypothetical protein
MGNAEVNAIGERLGEIAAHRPFGLSFKPVAVLDPYGENVKLSGRTNDQMPCNVLN